ncbi:MAG: lipocalin family protein [Bacteroidales bacterium]|nr:lipocalin family protein [Bacteroidales bacterium]
MKKILMFIMSLPMVLVSGCKGQTVNNYPVSELNLDKYLGRWYEIARYDHIFERGMQKTTAEYTLMPDGTVKVVNKGEKGGKIKTSTGVARLTDQPGVLKVSFFRPFWSDYRILMLGPDYEYVLVGSNSSKFLWILSRTPFLSDQTVGNIMNEIAFRDYDSSKLIWVEQ